MAKLTKDQIANIVKKHGFRIAEEQPAADVPRAPAEGATPDLERLRAKYIRGYRPGEDSVADAIAAENEDDNDDEIVVVEPENKPDPYSRAGGRKGVVISSRKKDIVGSQG